MAQQHASKNWSEDASAELQQASKNWCEHTFGLIENEDGTMVMVDATDITFTDRG